MPYAAVNAVARRALSIDEWKKTSQPEKSDRFHGCFIYREGK